MTDHQVLTWQVGDVRVHRFVELTTASLGKHLLPQATPEPVSYTHLTLPTIYSV